MTHSHEGQIKAFVHSMVIFPIQNFPAKFFTSTVIVIYVTEIHVVVYWFGKQLTTAVQLCSHCAAPVIAQLQTDFTP